MVLRRWICWLRGHAFEHVREEDAGSVWWGRKCRTCGFAVQLGPAVTKIGARP